MRRVWNTLMRLFGVRPVQIIEPPSERQNEVLNSRLEAATEATEVHKEASAQVVRAATDAVIMGDDAATAMRLLNRKLDIEGPEGFKTVHGAYQLIRRPTDDHP